MFLYFYKKSIKNVFFTSMVWRTEPLSGETETDERRRDGEVVDDRVDVKPTDQLVISSDQLK